MAGIIPIPTTRSSDYLVRSRLLTQLQADQLTLLRLQTQLSTGRRVLTPSDDAPASIRAISLQRLLEQKAQAQTNLTTSQSFLTASDSALQRLSGVLAETRGLAVSLTNETTTQEQRDAGREQISRALKLLVDVGNQKFRDRYLFAGAKTDVAPYELVNGKVVFQGNELDLQSYADIDLLLPSNIPGTQVFGGVSPEIKSQVDLNPILTADTRLADLHGGLGISKGSFVISDGVTKRTIDISSAETLGDVARLIEGNPPAGRTVTARITANHLEIDIDDDGGGNLTVREIGGGTTAEQLGILEKLGTLTNPVVGTDLNPRLSLTTELRDILGVRASAVVEVAGANNDIYLEALDRGSTLNGVAVQFVDDALLHAFPNVVAGYETATYSTTAVAAQAGLTFSGAGNNLIITANTPGTAFNNVQIDLVDGGAIGNAANVSYNAASKVLTIAVDTAGLTQAQTVINAINGSSPFTASYDASDPADGGFNPAALISPADAAANFGNTGNSGGEANTLFINIEAGATTANDVVAAINNDAVVSALFEAQLDGNDTTTAFAAGNGVIDPAASATTAGGSGIEFDQSSGLQIINNGQTYIVDFQEAVTVEDLLNTLNGSAANVLAEINADGTSINIRSRLSGADFFIGENGGTTATELGVRTFSLDTPLESLNHGRGVQDIDGVDFTIRRNDGVELGIDISSANTIGDVLDLINNHPLNTGDAVVASLASFGNGIQLVDDNPVGVGELTVIRSFTSSAAWDLGLVPHGLDQAVAVDAAGPTAAFATLNFDPPGHVNTALRLSANQTGDVLNGVQVVIANTIPPAAPPVVTFDLTSKTLTIDVDPATSTAADVIAAIAAEGTFSAVLDTTSDPTNDGSGLIVQTPGLVATTGGGVPNPAAEPATALATFGSPNTALQFTSLQPGTALNDVEIEFQDTQVGDVAVVTYDSLANRLIIEIDATAGTGTTANTVRQAVNNQGLFLATLDTTTDPTNDGSGVLAFSGVAAVADGGTAETFTGSDVNPAEADGVFTALIRLNEALANNDLAGIERAVAVLDEAFTQLNFSRAEIGASQQGLDVLAARHEDEHITLRDTLSNEIETDFAEAVSDLTARQAALQASLQLIGRTFQLTLLDFL